MKQNGRLKTRITSAALTVLLLLLLLPTSALAADQIWETKVSMQSARHSFQTEVIDGKIYAIGGNDGSATLSS